MRYFRYLALVVLIGSCDSTDDPDTNTQQPVELEDPLLVSVDVKGAPLLMFGYSGSETRLQTISTDGSIGLPELTFQGESQGLESDFHLVEINNDYYLLVAPTFGQMYFVDKKTGVAIQSWIPIDHRNTGKIACHESTCYFIDSDYKLYRLTNFLSTDAEFEEITSNLIVTTIQSDIDGTFFTHGEKGRFVFDGENRIAIPAHAGFWKGLDGYFRIIDSEGRISKYTHEITYEQSIPNSVTNITAISFPMYETTVGFQYKYDLLMFFELESPYATIIYPAPQMSNEIKPFFNIMLTGYGKYFYLLYGLPNKSKELRKLDVTTFTSTTSAVTTIYNRNSLFVALKEDLILTSLCRSPDGCQYELALLNNDGTFTFPTFWGQPSSHYVRF